MNHLAVFRSAWKPGGAAAIGVLISLLAGAQTPAAPWPADAARLRIHMIGQGHIDPVWLWTWPEGLSVVHSTFRSALERMKETPGFAFTASSSQFYAWVEQNDPQMLDEIRARVREGRWSLAGGWWVEPDLNIPSGEALVRQGLYGQRTLQRLFGQRARTGFNPDGFGHTSTLPQILKLQGLENYVFQRPEPHEKKLPASLFWWQGPDGTRSLTYRIPYSYNDEGDVRRRILRIATELKEPGQSFMAYYGVGDHGGGATKENLRSIAAVQAEPGAPALLFSTPERYFDEIRASGAAGLPVVADDLQHHSVGCYTAHSEIKQNNRLAETLLTTAEKISAVGTLAWGAAYPKAEFTRAWEKVLFNQFHDSLAGTALPEHYTQSRYDYHYAMSAAETAMYTATQKLAWQIQTEDADSEYLVVFNPHAWPTSAHIEYDLKSKPALQYRLEDETGKALAHQWAPGTVEMRDRRRLLATLPLPAFGYRQVRLHAVAAAPALPVVGATGNTLENEHLRATVRQDGSLALFDKDANREVFAPQLGAARALVMEDLSDTWSHDVKSYAKQIGAFSEPVVTLVESGPVRSTLRVRSRYGASTLTVEWMLYAGSRTLDARVRLDWHERHKLLKLAFLLNGTAQRATYETAYGHIVRDNNGNEEPGQRWVDVSSDGGDYGVAVINDAKYGYSVDGSELRISIVRGAPFAHHQPYVMDAGQEHLWQDQGEQTFRLRLVPHAGAWQRANLPREAEEFMAPLPVIHQGIHPGKLAPAASLLSVSAENVIVSAIKQAEEGGDLVLRCYESAGREADATVELSFAGRRWQGRFRPFEIKTLRFRPQSGSFDEVNLLEEKAEGR